MKKVYVPGSKSITNRALLLAALSDKPVVLSNVLDSDDSKYMQSALQALGVKIDRLGKNELRVTSPERLIGEGNTLFIGNAGTAARFLGALSLVVEGSFELRGVDRMHDRPQADLMTALSSVGVEINHLEKEGYLPAVFKGIESKAADHQPEVKLSGKVSSQFLSGLMLVAPAMPKGLKVTITDTIPSRPYVEMTVSLLKLWGVKLNVSDDFLSFVIEPGFKAPDQYAIPSDMSSASYPLAWSVLRGAPISIENFGTDTLQGDEQFLEVIKKVGAKITRKGAKLMVEPEFDLKPMGDWNWEAMPDVSMTGMVLAAFCPGISKFTGLESLRVKECDRIFAMEQLQHLSVDLKVDGDEVTVVGAPSVKIMQDEVPINSYDDHRIAMCFGVLKATIDLGADPHQKSRLKITEPECVAKTWPDFWLHLADWENQLRPVSALILKKEDNYLIVKKPREHNAWQFPQGGVDEGETGRQAAVRELQEECGASLSVKIKGERPVGEYRYVFPKDFNRHDSNIIGAKVEFFKADYIEGEVEVDGEEIIDHAWVTKEELKDYFEGEYLQVVKDLI
jgi:3-phosphoshikimate 1-carboxyvinyltransferase